MIKEIKYVWSRHTWAGVRYRRLTYVFIHIILYKSRDRETVVFLFFQIYIIISYVQLWRNQSLLSIDDINLILNDV